MLGLGVLGAGLYPFFPGVRKWMRQMCPFLGMATLALGVWELVTSCLAWLPLPYFPGPEGVISSLVNDRALIFDSTWHSLALLLSGYAIGTTIALITGVTIGWFPHARYWGMPILKVVGPIPATAWIPLAMVIAPSAMFSAVGLVALAVWFPVTMLTASGISNTRTSYLDVARTLGAGRAFLIFRVAIPAAMPNIFIGLFMGLGTSFLTLVVAETVGVKSGLGWYVSWAQGWAEYGKVYGALVVMAAFFSTIMTLLFKATRSRSGLAKGRDQMVINNVDRSRDEAASIRVWHVRKKFDSLDGGVTPGALALDDVSLTVTAGELVSVVGPSGCGKSTLLRMIAGLTSPTSGEVSVGAEPITEPSAERGLVFQDPNLFPWLTVRRNISPGSLRAEYCAKSAPKSMNSCGWSGWKLLLTPSPTISPAAWPSASPWRGH